MDEKITQCLSDQELRQLEVETFEIEDLTDAGQVAASTSSSATTSTTSSTTSCTNTVYSTSN